MLPSPSIWLAVLQCKLFLCMHAQYHKILKKCLGMSAVNATSFYETIKLLHPVVNTMVTEMCEMAKDGMKALSPVSVGSW